MSRRLLIARWVGIGLLILVVLFSIGQRIAIDWPNIAAGTLPADPFDHRYVRHPVPAYAHILPGLIYLVGAPFQLSRRFRTRHITIHRRMGRVVLPAGILAGVFAIVFGTRFAYGGLPESSATVVFGAYFVGSLGTAFMAIRRGDVTNHRRWMIRAFAIGIAIGTIRLWLVMFKASGLLSDKDSFGVAFWLSFVLHAIVAEAYLAKRPSEAGRLATT